MRIFSLVSVHNKNIPNTYESYTPISAAKKAASNIFLHSRKSVIILKICEKNTNKTFSYQATKIKTKTKYKINITRHPLGKKTTKAGGINISEYKQFLITSHTNRDQLRVILMNNMIDANKSKNEAQINEAYGLLNTYEQIVTLKNKNNTDVYDCNSLYRFYTGISEGPGPKIYYTDDTTIRIQECADIMKEHCQRQIKDLSERFLPNLVISNNKDIIKQACTDYINILKQFIDTLSGPIADSDTQTDAQMRKRYRSSSQSPASTDRHKAQRINSKDGIEHEPPGPDL